MNRTRFGLMTFPNADAFLISLLGFILIILFTSHSGIGISPDSIVYLSGARSLQAEGVLADYTQKPIVDFPAGYPLFLSLTGLLTRTDLVSVAPFLNGLLLAAVIVLTGYLIDTFPGVTKWYKWTILTLIAGSPALLDIYSMLWSETLFIFLTIVFMAVFSHYLKVRTTGSLLICAAVAAVACITRYAGVTLIGTGLLIIFLDGMSGWKKRITDCLLFGFVSVTLLLGNLLRNSMITGSLTGPRQKGILLLSDNIVFFGRVVCWWLPVSGEQARLVSGIAIVIFLFITLLFLQRCWFKKNYSSAENCFAAFFIVYTVFIIVISTVSHFEQINNRFISPVFIPMLIGISSWIPRAFARPDSRTRRVALSLLLAIVVLTGQHELHIAAEMYQEAKNYGIAGYTEDMWKHSPTAKFLREHQEAFSDDYTVYSNAHEAAYFNGHLPAESLPHRNDPRDIAGFFSEKGLYLVWFDDFSDNELIKFRTIWKNAEVVKKYDFQDGDIFFIRPHTDALRRLGLKLK